MKVTLYSADGKAVETVEAVEVLPVYPRAGHMAVALEHDPIDKIEGRPPKRYFTTNLPMTIDKGTEEKQPPPEDDPTFTVKLFSNSGDVIQTWHGAQGPYVCADLFGFFHEGSWIETTGYVMYERE